MHIFVSLRQAVDIKKGIELSIESRMPSVPPRYPYVVELYNMILIQVKLM